MKNDQPTLLILTPGFPEDENDSTCVPAQQLFVKVVNENFPALNIIVITFQYPFSSRDYLWNGIRIISFGGREKGKFYRLVLWLRVWRKLKKIKKANNVIGLLSFWCSECALIGKRFGRKHNLPHFAWLLGQDARKENKYVKLMRAKAAELIAMSDFLAEEFYRNFSIKPGYTIPNGIGSTGFAESELERKIDVLGAGSLIPLKRYEVFIEIMKELSVTRPSIKAVICGKGPEKNRLAKLIEALGLSDNLMLEGELPHHQVQQYMRKTKIFLHPSSYEGFSTACLEALYGGAHVISFCKPMNQHIRHWYIVNTKEEMLQKAIELLKDPAIEYESIMPFSMTASAKKMMELFNYKE
jgi:glycosyltransferase involved in cell wall biosynthesis